MTSSPPRLPAFASNSSILLAAVAMVLVLACGPGEATDGPTSPAKVAGSPGPVSPGPVSSAPDLASAPLGPGLIVWESGGRIFGRRLDGSPKVALTRDEPGREACCAHISPDGRFFVYLSLPVAAARYPSSGAQGELRLQEFGSQLDEGKERVLVAAARTYFEHRAVVFRDAGTIIYIDDRGQSRQLEVATGASRVLVESPLTEHGWLLDPKLRFATQGTPTFSPYDAAGLKVLPRPALGGCQPYFTTDGRFGFYIAGSGGPVRALDLMTRQTREILRKSDRRLPADRGYLYFPMISHDNTLLVWGASGGEHDHFTADYDIYIAELDPETLQLAGPPLLVGGGPGADRFPDVWSPAGARPRRSAPEPEEPDMVAKDSGSARPGEILVFRGGDHINLVLEGARPGGQEVSTVFEPKGRAFYDREFALDLRGGSFLADAGTMERLLRGAMATNEMSLELFFEPTAEPAAEKGSRRAARQVLFTFSAGPGKRRNFTLAIENGQLTWQMLTESSTDQGNSPRLELGEVIAGKAQHVVLTYAPGLLIVYRDGREVARSEAWREGFYPWRPAPLLFGREWEGGEAFQGRILGATIWDHVLPPATVAQRAADQQGELAARPAPPALRVRASLLARSPAPKLSEIAPYRQALAIYEYRLETVLEGELPPTAAGQNLRVVHRVLEDGELLPIEKLPAGQTIELRLEPFRDQPQLESLFLSNRLGEKTTPLFFSPLIEFE